MESFTRAFIGGRWVGTASGPTIKVKNPANGTLIGEVPNLGHAEAEQAIEAAHVAFPKWKLLSAEERGAKLKKLATLMLEKKTELGRVLTSEQGKPLREAEGEIVYSASFLEWFAEEGRRVYGETIPSSSQKNRFFLFKEPIGVCAGITPWNFPSAMLTRKMAPALAAGCTFIVKPAPETPFSALAVAKLSEEAGFPPGVINVITGDAEPIAQTLMKSEIVRKISFTGSTEVGKLLIRQSADTVKRITLELGGNAPFIVFEDADLERAVDGAIFQKYRNSGQTCICINRFLVHAAVAQEFTELFAAQSRKLKVGSGLDPDSEIGPLINSDQHSKVCELLQDAVNKGAKIVMGGIPEKRDLFVYPTVLTHVTKDMRIQREEIFGPVATITTFESEAEALALANGTEYGLASYVYTKDISRAFRVIENLQFGIVGLNDTRVSAPQAPFGGMKHSGFGKEGGRHGIEEYLHIKYVSLGL